MNKEALLVMGKRLNDLVYNVSVYDLDPSGIIVHAYSQLDSQEYILPVSEMELAAAGITRTKSDLTVLVNTIDMVQGGDKEMVLQSSNSLISKIRRKPSGNEVEELIRAPMDGGGTLHSLLVSGLVELCKVKPQGVDAAQYLGEWLLTNNPNQPAVWSPEDDSE
jgi:Dpy-30 motif